MAIVGAGVVTHKKVMHIYAQLKYPKLFFSVHFSVKHLCNIADPVCSIKVNLEETTRLCKIF